MKTFLLVLIMILSLQARQNPFKALSDNPASNYDSIPILNISNHQVLSTAKVSKPIKKTIVTPKHLESTAIMTSIDKPIIKSQSIPLPLLTPLVLEDKPTIVQPLHKPITKKHTKKKRSYRTIFKNYFLKIQTNNRAIKIYTKDTLLQKMSFKNPKRIAFDFDRLQYFNTKSVNLNTKMAKKIKIGSHHEFYRITLLLAHYKHVKMHKKSYGYLLTFL